MKKTLKVNKDVKVKIDQGAQNTSAYVFIGGSKKWLVGKIFKAGSTIEDIKIWADGFTPKYRVLSPDGFDIDFFAEPYHGLDQAIKALKTWYAQFKRQGYYSSVKHGRIRLVELQDFCQFIKKS